MSLPLRHPLRYRLEAAGAWLLFALLQLMSLDTASRFGGWLTRTLGPLTGAHRTARDNMARALPELSDAEREKTLVRVWDNFGRTMAEFALLPRLADERNADRIQMEGHEELQAMAAAGQPAILASAHLANWEVPPISLFRAGIPLTIVYRPANNPLVDAMVARTRRSYAAGLASKGSGGARQIMVALKAGGQVGMVVDQKINTGVEVPFFGRGAFTGPAVVNFAQHFDCPVFPVRVERLDGCRFKVVVEKPWRFSAGDDQHAALLRVNQRIEEWIRAQPDQWLWMHRRWPKA